MSVPAARPSRPWRRILGFILVGVPLTAGVVFGGFYYTEKWTGVSLFTSMAAPVQPAATATEPVQIQETSGEAVATMPAPPVSASPTGPELGPELQAALGPPGEVAFKDQAELNILVLGIDLNWTDATNLPTSQDARSDTMFVLHVEKDGRRIGMLSIPRDLYADLTHGHGSDRINAAFSYGGAMLSKQAVMHLLHVPIQHTVVVKLAGANKLLDELGGVDLKVEEDMSYDDNWGHLHVHLKKGWQHLDPAQAIGYARFRHDWEGDRGRMRRQQQFIEALIAEVRKPEHMASPKFVEELAGIFKQSVETDMTVADMVDLSRVYQDFDRRRIKGGRIDGDDTYVGGQAVITPPSTESIAAIVKSVLLGENTLKPQDVDVIVLAPKSRQQVASTFSRQFEKKTGCHVVKVDALPPKVGDTPTQMLVHTRDPDLYDMAPQLLPSFKEGYMDDVPLDLKLDPGVGMIVILGKDWKPPVASPSRLPTSPG
ncbi:MAG TPA: LCP family protein [Candidatus Xenobia bacterium]|jgi:LCP family protein required for cell wall assembly